MDIVNHHPLYQCNSEFYSNFNKSGLLQIQNEIFCKTKQHVEGHSIALHQVWITVVFCNYMIADQLALVLQTLCFVTSENEFCLTVQHFEVLCKLLQIKSHSIHAIQLQDIQIEMHWYIGCQSILKVNLFPAFRICSLA